MRRLIAQEAARVMEEEGIKDFYAAKRKAAERLGAPDTQNMPRNTEVEEAREEYLRLFRSARQPNRLAALRRGAVQAMELLADFQPRLVGSVLSGAAGEHSDINLHLFAATPEEVGLYLDERGIPYEQGDRRLRMDRDSYRSYPVYAFRAGDMAVDLTVFPREGLRQSPLSRIDGRPERRAGAAAVRGLLDPAPPESPQEPDEGNAGAGR